MYSTNSIPVSNAYPTTKATKLPDSFEVINRIWRGTLSFFFLLVKARKSAITPFSLYF